MYKFILAFRYLFKRRMSYLASAAVALCVFIVVIVMTVMTGLVNDYKQKNHDFTGDCILTSDSLVGFGYYEDFLKILDEQDFIYAASPVIKSFALLTYPDSGMSRGLEIMGVEPTSYSKATGFGDSVYHNKKDVSKVFSPSYNTKFDGCVLGIDLWLNRDTKGQYQYSNLYEAAFVISSFPLTVKGAFARAGAGEEKTGTFYYSDVSHSGLARVDGGMVYLGFDKAQELCGMAGDFKRVNAIHMRFKDGMKVTKGCEKVADIWASYIAENKHQKHANLFDHVKVQSWKENRRTFISAMEKEQKMMGMMFLFVGLTTAFVVFAVFYLIVNKKSKDIGILKSIGVSSFSIVYMYSIFAFLMGLISSAIGSLAGWGFLLKMNDIENWLFVHFGFQMWDRSIYAIGDIPSKLEFNVLVTIVISAILACMVGAFFPTFRAVRLRPVQSLQVDQL